MRFARIAHGGSIGSYGWSARTRCARSAPWEPDIVEQGASLSRRQLAPAAQPEQDRAIGRNYRAHAKELGNDVPVEPLLFLKPRARSCVGGTSCGRARRLASSTRPSSRGHRQAGAARERGRCAASRVRLLGAATSRPRSAEKRVQFTRAKSFDTFCPIGPWIETEVDPKDLEVTAA